MPRSHEARRDILLEAVREGTLTEGTRKKASTVERYSS